MVVRDHRRVIMVALSKTYFTYLRFKVLYLRVLPWVDGFLGSNRTRGEAVVFYFSRGAKRLSRMIRYSHQYFMIAQLCVPYRVY